MDCLNNCNYNCVHQLSKKLTLLWRIDRFIKDAKDCKHAECAEMWEKIGKDEEKHVEMLKKAIVNLSKQGKFN